MKFPNWFKIAWWALLVLILTAFLYLRYPDLKAGHAASADVVVFVIWMALLLAPLFNEISLLGITLKQEIAELRSFVAAQVTEVRNDVRNAIDVRTTISPSFHLPPPVDDAQLIKMEPMIRAAIADALNAHGTQISKSPKPLKVADDVAFLFSARYNIESELRRLLAGYEISTGIVPPAQVAVSHILQYLSKYKIIDPGLAIAVREVLAVCNQAVHGATVTEAQTSFVRELAPDLVSSLQAIK